MASTHLFHPSIHACHVTVTTAFIFSVFFFYPKYILLTALGQIILYYHYISDTIAGFLLVYTVVVIYTQFLQTQQKQ